MKEPEPNSADSRSASWKQGQADFVQAVYSRYQVDKGIVFADQEDWSKSGERRQYHPIVRPTLPFDLAKVEDGDVEAALNFVKEWGTLSPSYDIDSSHHVENSADSLWFIWGTAHQIRLLLRLWKGIRSEQPGLILDTLNEGDSERWDSLIRTTESDSQIPVWYRDWFQVNERLQKWRGFEYDLPDDYKLPVFGSALEIPIGDFPERDAESFTHWEHKVHSRSLSVRWHHWPYQNSVAAEDAEKEALLTILEAVSAHLHSIEQYLTIYEPENLWSHDSSVEFGYKFQSLAQVAYWHLARMVTQGQTVARCKECRALFSQSDRRQRFCPPSEIEIVAADVSDSRAQSKCGMRFRTRQARSRKEARK